MYRNPDAYISQGLADVEFSRPKNENDIKKLFEKIGYGVTDEEFNKIINHVWIGIKDRQKVYH